MATSCPICYDDDASALTKLPCCGKSCCKDCLKRWFETEQTTGQPTPTCPLEACRRILDPEITVKVGGKPWVAAGTAKKRKRVDNATVDAQTQQWLYENTLECGGCQTPLTKSEGCDKLQCLCGYRVCWNCKAVGALCLCNPGHGFIDNVTGRPQWGPATRAKPEELEDLKQYLNEQKKKDPLEALLSGHPALARRKRRREEWRRNVLADPDPFSFSRSTFFPLGAFPFAFSSPSSSSSSSLAANPFASLTTRDNPQVASRTTTTDDEDAFAKATRLSLGSMEDFDKEMAKAVRLSLQQQRPTAATKGKSALDPVWILDDDDVDRKPPAKPTIGSTASDPLCLSDSDNDDDEEDGPTTLADAKKPPAAASVPFR